MAGANKIIKEKKVSDLKTKFSDVTAAIVTQFQGINVEKITQLRADLRKEGIKLEVIKNKISSRAVEGTALEGLKPHFKGPTALASSKEDAVAPARIIEKFIKETEKEVVTVKAGIVEGEVMDAAGIKVIANLPNREGMLSMLLSVLQAPVRNVAYAVKAVAEKEPVAAE